MKHCSLCGAAIADDAVRCPLCGLPMAGSPPVSPPAAEDAADWTAPTEPVAAANASGSALAPEDTQPVTEGKPVDPPVDAESTTPADESQPVPDGRIRFEQPPAAPPPPQTQYAAPAPGPHYQRVLPQQPDGGLTTAQYFWTLMLFAVPVVGLGFMLYWSFGRTASPARRRLARASLIKVGVGAISALASLILVFGLLIGFARNRISHFFNHYSDPYRYFEEYDDPSGWYRDFYNGFGSSNDWFDDFFTQKEPSRIY